MFSAVLARSSIRRLATPGAIAALAGLALVGGVARGDSSTSLTIYSSAQPGAISPEMYSPGASNPYGRQPRQIPGFAIIRREQDMQLAGGVSVVRLTDVAALIDPTSVLFQSLTAPDAVSVLEQNFEFDLVSSQRLLEKYLDREIGVVVQRGDQQDVVRGTLLSTSGGLVLRTNGGGVRVLSSWQELQLPALPDGLLTRPTLVWRVNADQAGEHRARIAYETKGIAWWADYNLVFREGKDANTGELDVSAWVSILNQSGATYEDAKLKLVAGSVNRAPVPQSRGVYAAAARMELAEDGSGFDQKAFFEYHLYTLGRPTTIADDSTKQIELFPSVTGVPCEKILLYSGLDASEWFYEGPMLDENLGVQSKKDVDVYLRFKNVKEQGMGMPLPAGRIRVSQLDQSDQSLEFVGEDVIRHTPRNEEVLVKLGKSFDVVGERTRLEFRIDHGRRWMEEVYQIEIRNQKAEPVSVIIQERLLRWSQWEITDKSQDFKKLDSRTIHFPVRVNPEGKAQVKYTVRYTW
ncbi:MAG: DUF4139 domain-containing protein [Planctomycetota bacterium]|nr:DUF4139 domain-containing protein [Planctomycetota bacterium]